MKQTQPFQSLWWYPLRWFSATKSGMFRRTKTVQSITRFLPPQFLFLLAMVSVQFGAASAKSLFLPLGSTGTVFLRLTFAAIVLLCIWRPRLSAYTRSDYALVALFGVSIAAMNGLFYASISRIPLGIAVTLEFVGPLTVALVASRRLRDVLWTLFAAAGVILLAPIRGAAIDPLGVGFALAAGGCWAAYIFLNVRVGRVFSGGTGLALGMGIAAIVFAPFGLRTLSVTWHTPSLLLVGFGVALLSSVIPFSLEMETLRRMSPRLYGVLASLEPVVGAVVGLIVLGEAIGLRAFLAMALIAVASGGVSFGEKRNRISAADGGIGDGH
jgi:Predicted permease, DMT superfamily